MSAWAILEDYFGDLTPAEVAAELGAPIPQGATPASAAAASYLAEHGGPDLVPAEPGDLRDRRAIVAARTLSDVMGSAMTLDETAVALGVSRSRVSHRIGDRTLWAFTIQGRRYVPRWQVAGDKRTLPGLEVIVPAIPSNLHPLAVEGFMTTSQAEFEGASPVEWLARGDDAAVIAEWLVAMARW
jgi:hypothetical protein